MKKNVHVEYNAAICFEVTALVHIHGFRIKLIRFTFIAAALRRR